MSLPIPDAERRSGQVIQLSDFRPRLNNHVADAHPYAEAARHWDVLPRANYRDDLGPWSVEAPTPMARAIAAIETGVLTEELLFGGIVLRLPPARSPMRAMIRQIAARPAR